MRHLALMLTALLPGVALADWVALTGEEVAAALTGRTLVYLDRQDAARTVDTTQDFRASGKTLYTFKGRDSWGNWRIEGDQYCSQWPPNDLWACYGLERQGDRLRFVGERDDITEAIYAD
ncbi:MAG: hypothetical protein AAF727_10400 [Pseudomonadota bacterium]